MHKYPFSLKFQWTKSWVTCFFPHSPTHRCSRRSRRKCNPPTMRFSWCLVELELKYISKAPDTVGYIRRMRSIDFSELRALRMNLFFAGGPHRKRKKTPFRHRTVDDLRRLNTYLVVLGIWVRFVQNLFKNSTLGETLQLLQPFLWRSVRHSSPITSNLTLYLSIRISFCSWRGNFNASSAHGSNEEYPIFLRREKANNQRRNTLLWLKPTAQIFILSQKAIELNLLILSVKFKGELAVTDDQASTNSLVFSLSRNYYNWPAVRINPDQKFLQFSRSVMPLI